MNIIDVCPLIERDLFFIRAVIKCSIYEVTHYNHIGNIHIRQLKKYIYDYLKNEGYDLNFFCDITLLYDDMYIDPIGNNFVVRIKIKFYNEEELNRFILENS